MSLILAPARRLVRTGTNTDSKKVIALVILQQKVTVDSGDFKIKKEKENKKSTFTLESHCGE